MKYNELIRFEPIESVVQLKEASQKDYAYSLIDTYVISDRMAELIDEIIIEQLQYSKPADNKGILVVGNYGTGKSHLMSVIGTIAETEGSSERISNDRVAKRAKEIEGRFKVIRSEIGATTMSLRDFVCGEISDSLMDIGIDFSFPPIEEVRSNKDAFVEMMGKFNEIYSDKGLVLVLDELLDYLRSRKQQEIILDLGFLRELGEICRFTKFRFIAGVQEMLFNNPKFQFVAEQLRRVKERFEQVSIVREDIAYVVSERLLKKDDKQKALIREHLKKYTLLYEKLGERMEEYVCLFPIHPAYLSTFEKVVVAEKRVILKTISNEIKKLLDTEVPKDHPGLISFDSYWKYIEADASLKSNPDIREVMTKSKILQDRVQNAFTKPTYKQMAMRIVHALSVNRLTTGDIYTKLGVTSEELRDGLFLCHPALVDQEVNFLRTTIESVLKEILKTVSWQYISFNEGNGQYYIDINKDIAVDDLIEQKSETLSGDQLDTYYFEVLEQLTDRSKNTYVTGYRIWTYELPWWERKVTRQGYLFFGAPTDRSTAQPPRDFYIYMLQLFDIPKYKDKNNNDEVFFKLKIKDEMFLRALRLYSGSREMAITAASGTKSLYEQKAIEYLQRVTKWLRDNFLSAFEVTYKGKTKKVVQWTNALPGQASIREIIENVSSTCLSDCFKCKYEDYPSFSKLNMAMTRENMSGYIQDAYKYISGTKTKSGAAILGGFVMLDDDKIRVDKSGYAKWIINLLESKQVGQVVNRSDIIEIVYTMQGTEDVEITKEFSIEPELFSVVLVALVYNGNIVMTINGTQYDAMKLSDLVRLPIGEIIGFSHIKKPSGLPLPALKALYDLLDITHGNLQHHNFQFGIVQMNDKVDKLVNETVTTIQAVMSGIPCWDGAILAPAEQQQYKEILDKLKEFLESLLIYNAPAKLNNFKYSADEVNAQRVGLDLLGNIKRLQQNVNDTSAIANYVVGAGQHLPMDHEWQEEAQIALEDLLYSLKNQEGHQEELISLKEVKKKYQEIYMSIHSKMRLNASDDNRKNALLNDKRFKGLKQLSTIELLPKSNFDALANGISSIETCWSLTQDVLSKQSFCPNCRFRPKEHLGAKPESLDVYEDKVQDMLDQWTGHILDNFKDDEFKDNIKLLDQEQQILVNDLLSKGEFVLPIDVNLIEGIKLLLKGIEKIEIKLDEIKDIMGNGNPVTVEDLRFRFERMLRNKVGNQPINRVRVMLEE